MTSRPQILIVEDDPSMAELLSQGLSESGFHCKIAPNGAEALKQLSGIDVILSDIMMPIMNGLHMTTKVRESGNQTPIIFITAKDQTRDTVAGLEAGGDDYIVKPFEFAEVIARINSALRRSRLTSELLCFGDLVLDSKNRTVVRQEHELFLSTTEYCLLEFLVRNPNQVWSKTVLLKEVWQDEGYRDDNIVELYINYLRKKTECFDMPRMIQTVRGQGYVLEVSQH
ncbi:MAG: response regulator transcription factor [Armatimonadetes bacterium]|nr:response regulator transcription factor [Armatimonadota bacterium]